MPMQYEDKYGINVISLSNRQLSLAKLNPSDLAKTLFAAEFDETATLKLFEELAIHLHGTVTGRDIEAVVSLIQNDPNLVARDIELLRQVMQQNHQAVAAFVESELGAHEIRNLAFRRRQLEVMRKLLYEPEFFEQHREQARVAAGLTQYGPEKVWQEFFEINRWIFGLGLDYRIGPAAFQNRLEQVIQGANATAPGHRVDAVLRTRGLIGSLCLVEIKHHFTDLLIFNDAYRSGVWQASKELTGGIAQCQVSVSAATQNTTFEVNDTFKVLPKSVLVIGSLSQFQNPDFEIDEDQFRSFELLRQQMVAPEIVTFDELYSRAQAMLVRDEAHEILPY